MPRQTLNLNTIGDVDHGALRIAFNQNLKLLTQDLTDRPALDKARTLILKVDIKPVVDKNSNSPNLESTDVTWQILTKVPAIGSSGVVMRPQHDGQLFFHSELPEEPENDTIQDEAERRRLERERDNKKPGAGGNAGQ